MTRAVPSATWGRSLSLIHIYVQRALTGSTEGAVGTQAYADAVIAHLDV